MQLDWFLIALLATFRFSSLLVKENGPFDVFGRLRGWMIEHSFLVGLFSCVWCISVPVGIVCTLLALSPVQLVLVPFAVSTGAIMVSTYVTRQN